MLACSCPEVAASEEVLGFLGCPKPVVVAAAEVQQQLADEAPNVGHSSGEYSSLALAPTSTQTSQNVKL